MTFGGGGRYNGARTVDAESLVARTPTHAMRRQSVVP